MAMRSGRFIIGVDVAKVELVSYCQDRAQQDSLRNTPSEIRKWLDLQPVLWAQASPKRRTAAKKPSNLAPNPRISHGINTLWCGLAREWTLRIGRGSRAATAADIHQLASLEA